MSRAKLQQPLPTAKQIERWQSEKEIIFDAFNTPKTMYQVSKETNIERPNVCRRLDTLRKEGRIVAVKMDIDPLTQRRAQYFCTDKRHWPGYHFPGTQAKLFES